MDSPPCLFPFSNSGPLIGLSALSGSEMVEKEKVILSDICEQIGQAYIELVEVRVDTLLAFYL